MAHLASQEKRNRQNEKRRKKNAQVKSSIRTASKSALKAIDTKDKEASQSLGKKFVKTIDSAVHKGMVHKNTAARKKSRLAKKINKVIAQ